MKDTRNIIKSRLAAIQGYFNPEKNTYKVIGYVVNNDLSYDEMLSELSKIRGFSKYPEQLKNEYISIINEIKENIIKQRRREEKERQLANTKELKDIIDSLEKTRVQYITKQVEKPEEVIEEKEDKQVKSKPVIENSKSEEKKEVKESNKKEVKEEVEKAEESEELEKTKKGLVVGIIVIILLIIAAILFY